MLRTMLLLTLATAAVMWAGCGSTSPSLNPAQAQTAGTSLTYEGHTGQLLFQGQQEPALLDFEFQRQGQNLTGVGRIIVTKDQDLDGVDISVGNLTGVDNGQTHSFSIEFGAPYGQIRFEGISDSNGFSGSHNGTVSDNINAQNGGGGTYQSQITAVTSDSAPLTGRYRVTLDDGTTMDLNITEPASPDPNLPDVVGLSHIILGWVGDTNAMQPMDAGGGSYLSGRFTLRVNPFDSQRYPFLSCLLFGGATSGRYVQFRLQGGTVKQGTYTMQAGFNP